MRHNLNYVFIRIEKLSLSYGSPFKMIKNFRINFTMAGENIALGQRTPKEVMNSWMNSPGHRSNILNPNYTEIGVGIAYSKDRGIYWTQMFIRP
ncbi:cysteine-rich secretory protein family protein [Clostridium tepidiprofundi DSM 19306]|uniref:Cysteine-rich secretory protein family protein n=1 Tax=Clostridium tepidiprofundi DSM 19306 TaxID=1121338 RepID=A0A151B541_9CLOT|nr:cysteine-rich secretory protein family protein [Clostridium tepidiprofundi DSM 19306]